MPHSDEDLIRELENQFNTAWGRHDPEGMAESLADDAQFITVNGGGHLFTQKGASPTPAQITDDVVQFFVKELRARP